MADKGSPGTCGGSDWVELFNPHSQPVGLAGLVLHDDNGAADSSAFALAQLAPDKRKMAAGAYLLVCVGGDGVSSPAFKIGGGDTVSLTDGASGEVVSTTGKLPGENADGERSVGYFDGVYKYTYSATPGRRNALKGQPGTTTTITTTGASSGGTNTTTASGKCKHSFCTVRVGFSTPKPMFVCI